MKKETYKVEGMHCATCVATIENVLSKTKGVKNASVNFAAESALIEFDENTVSKVELAQVTKEAGYDLILDDDNGGINYSQKDGKKNDLNYEREKRKRLLKSKLIIGGILSVIILLITFSSLFSFIPKFLNNDWILLFLAIPVQFWVGSQFYSGLKVVVKYHTADMNTLVAVATLSAFIYSTAVTIFPSFFTTISGITPAVYFDTSAIIIVLVLLGKYFEVLMKGRASEAIKKLVGLQPKTARVIKNNKEIEISISEVQVGDSIVVRPGERIPVDGEIIEGDSEIDESMVTGESMPIHKKIGDTVIGSTINKFGAFTFRTTKIGKDTMLSQIIKMVEEAQGSKAPIQRLADKVSSYFVPGVFIISIITFIVWLVFGPAPAFTFALINFIAVLIIACPCALGLATPMAIMVSSGSAASKGILIKDATSVEIANKIDTVVLDKTGTITEGKPKLTDILVFNNSKEEDVLRFSASLEKKSEHSLAKAIIDEAEKKHLKLYKSENTKAIPGKGLQSFLQIGNKRIEVHLGNAKLMKDLGINILPEDKNIIKELEDKGKTVMTLIVDNKIIGAIAVADTLKKESIEVVKALKKDNIDVWMITGDNELTAKAIATQVGIDNIMSGVLPDKKSEKVKNLQEQGKIVAMIGDGINDAPALAQADLGIAMGEGTDIAMESANITLMRGNLMLIPEVIKISRRTMKIIKQNLFWAFFYNIAFIPIAAGILYPVWGILLNPIFASIAMASSSISVVFNSLRLRKQ